MSVSVSVNGTSYTIPQTGETGWGAQVTAWIQAVSSATLQKNGGTFTLTADADFGASFGLKSAYYKSRSAAISTAGLVRLASTESIGWRNAGDSANLLLLPKSGANGILTYGGIDLVDVSTAQTLTNKTLTSPVITGLDLTSVTLTQQGSTPSTPASGKTTLYSDTSDLIKHVDDSGTVRTLVDLGSTQTLTNKTLTTPNITTPVVSSGVTILNGFSVPASGGNIGFDSLANRLKFTDQFSTSDYIVTWNSLPEGLGLTNCYVYNNLQYLHQGSSPTGAFGSVLLYSKSDEKMYTMSSGSSESWLLNNKSYLETPEMSTPSTPASGYGRVYFKSDGKLYILNDSGVESQLGTATNTHVGFRAYKATSQSYTASSDATIQFDTEVYDTDSAYNTATYTFTAPSTAYYQFTARVFSAASTVPAVGQLGIKVNGTSVARSALTQRNSGDDNTISVSVNVSLTAGDTVTAYYNSSQNSTLTMGSTASMFSGYKI